jgi:hypothetical protein
MRGAQSGRYVALAFGVLGAALVACGGPDPTEPDPAPKAGGWRVSGELGFPFGQVNDVDGFDADNIWVASDHVAEEDDGSSIARWDGRRWAKVELPEDFGRASWMQVRVAGPRDVWAWGTGYSLDEGRQWKEFRRWDGSTWHKVAVPTAPDGFAIVASDDVWVVAETDPRASHWDGNRWRAFEGPPSSCTATRQAAGPFMTIRQATAPSRTSRWSPAPERCGQSAARTTAAIRHRAPR